MSTIKGLATSEIAAMLQGNKFFAGVYPCDRIPEFDRRPFAVVVNTDPSAESGEHWVVLILKTNEKGLYFDSFGFPPLIPQLQQYLTAHAPNGFKYNSITLQHPNSKACGYYCVAFVQLWSKRWTLSRFCTFFAGRMGRELVANDSKLMDLFV